ncbi:MAG: putative outer rane lipoprotein [Myxococcaceae bacterium]|nr:putative outer rane lipoprotein [Myxococcaceae bacterium]
MKRSLALLPLLVAAACSSNQAYAPTAGAYRTARVGPSTVATEASYGGGEASAVANVAPATTGQSAMRDDIDDGPRAQPSAPPANLPSSLRPGLATHWGEDRYSTVRTTAFERGSERPFDVATIHYNDARLSAMQAQREGFRWLSVHRDGIRISLRGESGEVLPGFTTGGEAFVIGQPGQRYSIALENHTSARIEAVLTVDGLDVINGQPGSTENRGYLVRPHGSIVVEGFRRSTSTVAAFRFGGVEGSYADERGTARNVGVVGVALFAERGADLDVDENEVELRRSADPFPGGFAPPPPNRAVY